MTIHTHMNVSITNNLKKFIFYYSLTLLIFCIHQLYLSNNFLDIICIFIVFISNIIILLYCFNSNYFFNYPISLLMIFFSHFINVGSSLIFKSLENSIITENLEYPIETMLLLNILTFSLILGHFIYRMSKTSNNLSLKINNQLNKINLINLENLNYLIFASVIVILMRVTFFDFNTTGLDRKISGGQFNIFQDIVKGIGFFIYMPLVIFFSNFLYNNKKFKMNYLFLFFFIISILFISFSTNNRSNLFDVFVISAIFLFLAIIFNKIDLKKNFLKFIIVLFLSIPTLNFFERLSGTFISERSFMPQRTPIQNFVSFISAFSEDSSSIVNLYKENKNLFFFAENYYDSQIFNRINILLVHDNFLFIKKNLTNDQKKEFINLQKNKIISILPQPIINIFTDNFNKLDYIRSTASSFYNKYYDDYTSLAIGSSLISLYIILDYWVFLVCIFLFIPVFILFDSFYDKKNQIFSPFILIFFYTTGYGVLKFFSSTEISNWIELPLRIIPQTIVIFLIMRFFLKFFYSNKIEKIPK